MWGGRGRGQRPEGAGGQEALRGNSEVSNRSDKGEEITDKAKSEERCPGEG